MNYTVSNNPPPLVDGTYWYNAKTGSAYVCRDSKWIMTSLASYLSGVDNKQGVEALTPINWEAKYKELEREFDNFKENTYADLLADLGEAKYEAYMAELREQVIKDIRVSVYKEAREHWIMQFAEANDQV